MEFMCQNVGLSAGKFCVIPKDQWPASNIRVKNSSDSKRNDHDSVAKSRKSLFCFPSVVAGKDLLF